MLFPPALWVICRLMKKRRHIHTPDINAVQNISASLKLSHITSSVLVNRGITSPEQALSFIHISLDDIRPPFGIKDMDAAVRRIYKAVKNKEKILIFGDYDADGITATAVLCEFFNYIGVPATYYIPHRKKEGYGLQPFHISSCALPGQIGLIITVDCGTTDHEAVSAARRAGIDVIVIDHHNTPDTMPDASAVVNPKRRDCTAGFNDLSGVGMAFCVLICLRKYMRDKGFWNHLPEPNLKTACDLVALGTIADMVPLTGENRILLKAGIDMIRWGDRPGLTALVEVSGIDKMTVTEEDIAFRLAPRLNAAGRIDHAGIAVALLVEKSLEKAKEIAQTLNALNTKRQAIEKQTLAHIESVLNNHPELLNQRSLVLADREWDEGVLGIVASKLIEKYFRPVVLFAVKDNVGKGSSRSIPGFDLYDGLRSCSTCLQTYGGHKMAAGLKIDTEKLDTFKTAFEGVVRKTTRSEDFTPAMDIDLEIGFNDISESVMDEIERLKPFGTCNAEPVFLSRQIKVLSSDIVGGNHHRMRLGQTHGGGKHIFNAIRFNTGTGFEPPEYFENVVFKLRWNRWNGQKSLQMVILDVEE